LECRMSVNHTIFQSKPARKLPIRPIEQFDDTLPSRQLIARFRPKHSIELRRLRYDSSGLEKKPTRHEHPPSGMVDYSCANIYKPTDDQSKFLATVRNKSSRSPSAQAQRKSTFLAKSLNPIEASIHRTYDLRSVRFGRPVPQPSEGQRA
jgi:hypothetical protein